MRFCWFFSSLLGTSIWAAFASPLAANQLQFWRFNPTTNQLVFTTESGVQPRVQLLSNPTRLVIDLPGIRTADPILDIPDGNAVREVRIDALTPDSTRLVLELNQGYTLDPQQVQVRGSTPTQWLVQLPISSADTGVELATEVVTDRAPANPPVVQRPPIQPESSDTTVSLIQAVQLNETGDQLIIQADGAIAATGEWDRPSFDYRIDIPNARLSATAIAPEIPPGSTFRRIRLQQVTPDRVAIFVTPAAGISFDRVSQDAPQTVSLGVLRPNQPLPAWVPGDTVPEIALPSLPNSRVLVVIDPGHGGRDPGAIGIGGLREIDVVMPVSLEVARLLEEQGLQVVMTRQDDRTLDLEPRVQIANRANADIFVSIHANAISMSRPDVNGLETYYYSSSGQPLAAFIQASMLEATGMRDRGVKRARFYVLRNTNMPAALVEVGFVTGEEDAPRLSDPDFHRLIARAIARGILQYIQR